MCQVLETTFRGASDIAVVVGGGVVGEVVVVVVIVVAVAVAALSNYRDIIVRDKKLKLRKLQQEM